jgi:hypothetical protein
MVLHCIRDDFKAFLDKDQYVKNATVFDAIGLPPGSAPRNRNLIGHHVYSDMTEGVGRGVIFNHRDPMHSSVDYVYTQRTVERFRSVLGFSDRKMFVILNLNKQLWSESEILELFQELDMRTSNFIVIAVNCMKNLGPRAATLEIEESVHQHSANGQLLVYTLPCQGDNTGSYFRDDFDAQRIRSILIAPYRFSLKDDPLPKQLPLPANSFQEKESSDSRVAEAVAKAQDEDSSAAAYSQGYLASNKPENYSRWMRRSDNGHPQGHQSQEHASNSCDGTAAQDGQKDVKARRWASKKTADEPASK